MTHFVNDTKELIDNLIEKLETSSWQTLNLHSPLIRSKTASLESVDIKITQTSQDEKKETIFSFIKDDNTLMSIRRLNGMKNKAQIFFYVGDVYHQNTIEPLIAEKIFNRFAYKDCLISLNNELPNSTVNNNVISIRDKVHPQVQHVLKYRK